VIKLKKILKESKYAWDRKFGDPLPTFKDIAETHQNKPKETINEAKLWNYFNEVSNVLSDLRMKGWLRKAEKQNPELKRDLKKVEKAASQLMIWIDDIADRLD